MGPVFGAVRGHHRWLVEPAAAADPAVAGRLAAALDAALMRDNDDYAAHRRGGQMDPPEVLLLPPGAFAAWMPPGLWTACGDALRRPHGHVYWAGTEVAERWAGFFEGAVRSGEEAAAAVGEMLSQPPPLA